MAMKTYQGACHCGAFKFEVDMDLDHVRRCDCSVCRRRGALIHRVSADCLRMFSPLETLKAYEWHTRTAKDYFCPRCGILPFRRPSAPTREELAEGKQAFSGWAVNVRCLQDIDVDSIPVVSIFGSRLR